METLGDIFTPTTIIFALSVLLVVNSILSMLRGRTLNVYRQALSQAQMELSVYRHAATKGTLMDFNTRANSHVQALATQLVNAFSDYAAELDLDGAKLAELLEEAGIDTISAAGDGEVGDTLSVAAVTEESCEFILENADKLGAADALVLLEAIGAQINLGVLLPPERQKKLMTPRKQHRLQVAKTLDEVPRKLGPRGQQEEG